MRTWLCGITKNLFYKQLRHKKREVIFNDELPCVLSSGELPDPQEIFQNKLLHDAIIFEITRLNDKQKNVVILRLFSELPFSQIAAVLKISKSSAKTLYHRARLILRERLRDDYKK